MTDPRKKHVGTSVPVDPGFATAAPSFDPGEIWTFEDVAQRLKLPSVSTVKAMIRPRCPNPIPHFHAGKLVRFSRQAVERWIVEQQKASAA